MGDLGIGTNSLRYNFIASFLRPKMDETWYLSQPKNSTLEMQKAFQKGPGRWDDPWIKDSTKE